MSRALSPASSCFCRILVASFHLALQVAAGGGDARAAQSPATKAVDLEPVRGVTLSTHRAGREWGEVEVVRPTLEKIRGAGANWVAYHPYARIDADGTVRPPRWSRADEVDHVRVPIVEARKLGLRIMVKPHLAYWGSPFGWRGEIRFETEQDWERFFDSYRRWIVDLARLSVGADVFVVGTELDATIHRDEEWRELIAAVREVQSAPLTYAANWTDFMRLEFWRDLDMVGIQAYFPVSREQQPSAAQVEEFWRTRMETLADFSRGVGRPLLFTEIGYSRTLTAATRPWLGGDDVRAESLQTRLTAAALSAVEAEPTVLGAFLWKWFPEPRPVGADFPVATPAMQAVLRQVWQAGTR